MASSEKQPKNNGTGGSAIAQPPGDLLEQVKTDVARAGGEIPPDPNRIGAIGATMFDLPGSEDHAITILLPKDHSQSAPSQALVRIKSADGRQYLGMVTAGPFAEPDTLRADSRLLVTVTSQGGIYLPPYHGRVHVAILGEEIDGNLAPPRLRPLPNSPVFVLDDEESARVLQCTGDLRLGLVVGHSNAVIGIPSDKKHVLPRHTAILGTTGSGKSNTVARLVQQAVAEGFAVILLDVEGEYSHLHRPADDQSMLTALQNRNIEPAGIAQQDVTSYPLVGRGSSNPQHPNLRSFSLQFANLSPYAASEILNLSEPMQIRFFQAYDIAKELLRDLGIFPQKDADADQRAKQERMAMELDEFERGYPRLTLSLLIDVVGACLSQAEKSGRESSSRKKGDESETGDSFTPFNTVLQSGPGKAALWKRIHSTKIHSSTLSWRALLGRLGRLNRLRVFYDTRTQAKPIDYRQLLQPGKLSIIDLSDSGASELNNIVITDLLRGVQKEQQRAYRQYEKGETKQLPRVLLIIEEAHEFLSSERIDKLNTLFEQVSRIAKRGRKRWFSLAFVTQLPQHMPRSVLGLCNNFILHKLSDPQVVQTLRRTIGGIDESLWNRLPGLAPGQAIVSFGHMSRPLLASIDPATCKLLMMD